MCIRDRNISVDKQASQDLKNSTNSTPTSTTPMDAAITPTSMHAAVAGTNRSLLHPLQPLQPSSITDSSITKIENQ